MHKKLLILAFILTSFSAYAREVRVVNKAPGFGVSVLETHTLDSKSDIQQNPAYVGKSSSFTSWNLDPNSEGIYHTELAISGRDLKHAAVKDVPICYVIYIGNKDGLMMTSVYNIAYSSGSPTSLICDDNEDYSDKTYIVEVRPYDPSKD